MGLSILIIAFGLLFISFIIGVNVKNKRFIVKSDVSAIKGDLENLFRAVRIYPREQTIKDLKTYIAQLCGSVYINHKDITPILLKINGFIEGLEYINEINKFVNFGKHEYRYDSLKDKHVFKIFIPFKQEEWLVMEGGRDLYSCYKDIVKHIKNQEDVEENRVAVPSL